MREPQATSTLEALHARSRPARRALCAALAMVVVTAFSPGVTSRSLGAQIRGGGPIEAPSGGKWLSGGAAAVLLADINDGKTGTQWRFGNDPLWQYRIGLEKATDDVTSIGIVAGYGRVPLRVVPFVTEEAVIDVQRPYPESCATSEGCEAELDLVSALLTFHSGGGPGFHTLFEATGGVTAFRNLKTVATSAEPSAAIGESGGSVDLTGTLGAGFGYTLSNGMTLNLVQDFGIGFHSKDDLPSGTSRTWRIRATRASLRFAF